MSPRGVPNAKAEEKKTVDVDLVGDEARAEAKAEWERDVREIVTASIQPHLDRISALEEEVNDLRTVVTAPQHSVQFFEPDPVHPQGDPDEDAPWYNPAR